MPDRPRNKKQDVEMMIYGKIPPQARDVEQSILGAILLERDAFDRVNDLLRPECFYVEGHQHIYESMQQLSRTSQPIDAHTVMEELRKREQLEIVGGPYYVTQLTNFVVNSAHTEKHCKIVYEKWLKREMIRLGGQLVSDAYEDNTDAFDLLDDLERNYQAITSQMGMQTITPLDAELVPIFKRIAELQQRDQHITGVPSGYYPLDKITHGWQPTDLIILAARPSVGKTAFALNLARNAARTALRDRPAVKVGMFSLEMSKQQLVERMLACESDTWLSKIKTGQLEKEHLQRLYQYGIQPLAGLGIYLDDTGALNVYQLRSKCRYMIRKFGVKLIIIDYLQLMSGVEDRKINNREQEISNISRNLKLLAKELSVPIIALSQLSRDVEKRKGENPRPRLSDLRDSGALEQDADMVMFLYRQEAMDETLKGQILLSITKNRHGALAQDDEAIKFRADLPTQKFSIWLDDPLSITQSAGIPGGNWRPVKTENQGLPFAND